MCLYLYQITTLPKNINFFCKLILIIRHILDINVLFLTTTADRNVYFFFKLYWPFSVLFFFGAHMILDRVKLLVLSSNAS